MFNFVRGGVDVHRSLRIPPTPKGAPSNRCSFIYYINSQQPEEQGPREALFFGLWVEWWLLDVVIGDTCHYGVYSLIIFPVLQSVCCPTKSLLPTPKFIKNLCLWEALSVQNSGKHSFIGCHWVDWSVLVVGVCQTASSGDQNESNDDMTRYYWSFGHLVFARWMQNNLH